MTHTFTAVFEEAPEGGYAAWVEELPGAISQGETLEEARENLKEAVQLMIEARRELGMRDAGEADIVREELVVEV